MAYEFKNLNEVPVQGAPTENTTVMAFEAGQPKQISASEFGGKGLVVDLRGYTLNTDGTPTQISDISYDPIYEAIMAGQNVVSQIKESGREPIASFLAAEIAQGLGFGVALRGFETDYTILFTNGSYHTTA